MVLTPKKFSALPAAAALAGTEGFPIVQSGANALASPSQIGDWAELHLGLEKIFSNNLNDDVAVALNIGHGASISRAMVFILPNNTLAGAGALWVNAAGVPAIEVLFQAASNAISVVAGAGSLLGTTGPDGFTNVRSDTGGLFYLENRSGATRAYSVFALT